jgi:murein peptide amidase A
MSPTSYQTAPSRNETVSVPNPCRYSCLCPFSRNSARYTVTVMPTIYRRIVLLVLSSLFTTRVPVAAQTTTSSVAPVELQESIIRYGSSVEGRPLVAVVLGSGANITLILGGIHGNEPSAPPVVEKLKAYLEHHPQLIVGCTAVLVSHVNPDGDAVLTRANADGVDLNRNFPYNWIPKRRGIALSPGSSALSEPESRGLVNLLILYHPSKIVSIHQPFDCLLPSGPGGEILAATMHASNGYTVKQDVGYPTPGSFGSYCFRTLGISATTLEMPWESSRKAWAQNRAALMAAIQMPPPQQKAPPT